PTYPTNQSYPYSLRSTMLSLLSYVYLPPPRYLHSFPTRRSSDLSGSGLAAYTPPSHRFLRSGLCSPSRMECRSAITATGIAQDRSEEHTSELQSRFDLVCRLLLEKKKYKKLSSRSWFQIFVLVDTILPNAHSDKMRIVSYFIDLLCSFVSSSTAHYYLTHVVRWCH